MLQPQTKVQLLLLPGKETQFLCFPSFQMFFYSSASLSHTLSCQILPQLFDEESTQTKTAKRCHVKKGCVRWDTEKLLSCSFGPSFINSLFFRVNGSPKERVCVHSLMGIPCFIVVRWQKIRRKLDSRMLQLRMHLLSTEPQGHSRSFSLVCWGLIKALWIMLSFCELIKRPLSLNFAFASGATVRTLVKSICSCFQSIKFKLK